MDRSDWIRVGCTLAIIATLIGCAWWIGYELSWISRDLEQLQR